MSLAIADSSKFVETLRPTFTEEQAERLSRALSLAVENLPPNRPTANREIKELELKIEEFRESTRKEIKVSEQATREEIKELELKIEESRESTRKEIEGLKEWTRKEIRESEQATRKEIKELERVVKGLDVRIAETKSETLKWTAGFLLAQTGAIAALFKLLQLL